MGAIRMRFQTADLKNRNPQVIDTTPVYQLLSCEEEANKQYYGLWIYNFKLKCVNDGFIYYKHAAFHCKTLINGLEPY